MLPSIEDHAGLVLYVSAGTLAAMVGLVAYILRRRRRL